MHPRRLLSLVFIIAVVCGWAVIHPAPVIGVTPVQMCTAQNVAGFPYSGSVCGGSVIDGCGPGAIYQCTGVFTSSGTGPSRTRPQSVR